MEEVKGILELEVLADLLQNKARLSVSDSYAANKSLAILKELIENNGEQQEKSTK